MTSYGSYREPALARSPTDRDAWASRDDSQSYDRPERSNYYDRARSPGADRQRQRRRSRSPLPVDRYEPNSRVKREYDTGPRDRDPRDRDDRRRSPPPRDIDRYIPGDQSRPPPLTTNPLADPAKLAFQVGFSYFGEWWRTNEKIKEERERLKSGKRLDDRPRGRDTQQERDDEKARIQVAYDAYKEELQARMANMFVQERKNDQWFQERYVAEVRDPLKQKINEFRRDNYSNWQRDFEAGVFDEYSLEGIPKNEVNGSGAMIEKEEGETTAVNEILGVGDLVPVKGSDIRDETAFQPTLLIKTIAPHVSRDKLVEFCKEHLGDGEGGFRWLSLSDPNPSKRYHRIGWVMLNAGDENAAAAPSYRPDTADEEGEEKKVERQQSVAEKALEAINGKQVHDETRGDFTCHVGVHTPPVAPRKKALWDLFSAPERIEKDLELARRLIQKYEEDFGSDFNTVQMIEERVADLQNQGLLKPAAPTPKKEKAKKDANHDADMDVDEGEEGEEEEDEGALDDEVDDEDLLVKKKQLDLMVEYLRRVFNLCFFCVFESDSVHELTRKCPGGHLRRPRSCLTKAAKEAAIASARGEPFPGKKRGDVEEENQDGDRRTSRTFMFSKTEQQLQRAFNWVRTFEEKLMQLLEPEKIDVRKLGGRPVDEAIDAELIKYVKQEDEHKFRCKVPECTKLFKEEHFWRKHVEKRHPEFLESMRKDFELVNTYVSDPAHIAPSRSDANSNGHFPPANGHQPAGTPRGFSLNQFGGPGNFPSFGGYNVQTPPGWMPSDERGGPIRRGGGRFQSQRPGPYDRPGQRRFEGGRLSPPGGGRGGRPGMGGRFDSMGGAASGPREAVVGRSIKSYEDLDAVGGGGAGELNY